MPKGMLKSQDQAPDEIRNAESQWKKLTADQQHYLAREVAEQFGPVFIDNHPDVVSVIPGRKESDSRLGRAAVIFVVNRKRTRVAETKRLPKYLPAYTGEIEQRRLVAVPTDVLSHSIYTNLRPNSMRIDSGGNSKGAIACALGIDNEGDDITYALSARHVLLQKGRKVTIVNTPNDPNDPNNDEPLGEVAQHMGEMQRDGIRNLDAAMIAVKNVNRIKLLRVLGGRRYDSGVAASINEVRGNCYIATPRGLIRGSYWAEFNEFIKYKKFGRIYQKSLIQIKVEARTKLGDSGSPVISRDRKRWLGMHIAGNDGDLAVMIPSYRLIDHTAWANSEFSQDLRIITNH